jgi:hypothetical protein
MASAGKLHKLRTVITENLRVQRDGKPIKYVDIGNALQDARAKQNHTIFARRGCGKTLLLHDSRRQLPTNIKAVYLNCEDFKQHSFPNVLIEILRSLFKELEKNLTGWFGKKAKSKQIIKGIISRLNSLQREADAQDEEVVRRNEVSKTKGGEAGASIEYGQLSLKGAGKAEITAKAAIDRSFKIHKDKLQELDRWLPELKDSIRDFFDLSTSTEALFLQIDDLYHLKRTDQAFVVDYIHRLCKDVPLYFKFATLRHASTLYVDRDGQPIGAQERHDYQPINVDFTFGEFKKTESQNWRILEEFAAEAGVKSSDLDGLFKGEGFTRLVMAGGGVPRDVLSLFLQLLSDVDAEDGGKIGKDEVRIASRTNFERKIEELKQDSQGAEQDDLLRGIYAIREFCLDKKTNVFVVSEKLIRQNDQYRALFYRLLDYRIIHSCATALTHKSQEGTFQAFAIDIGSYAHLRKLQSRFTEIDVSRSDAKEKMRSAPVLDEAILGQKFASAPDEVEAALLQGEEA